MSITIVNVKKKELNKRNIKDFTEWNESPDTLYIGRNMSYYVPGTIASKWANPFAIKMQKDGGDNREECLKMYKSHIKHKVELFYSLYELDGKELGCWCAPERCHGNVLHSMRLDQKHKIDNYKSAYICKQKYKKFEEYFKIGESYHKDKKEKAKYYLKIGFISKFERFDMFEKKFAKYFNHWYNTYKYSDGKEISKKQIMKFTFKALEVHQELF